MKFKEVLQEGETPSEPPIIDGKAIPVKKAQIKIVKGVKNKIRIIGGKKFPKKSGYHGPFPHPKKPTDDNIAIYVKHKEGATVQQIAGSSGAFGYMYVINIAKAHKRSMQMSKLARRTSGKRAHAAKITRNLNK